ncbi:4-hydroxy-tetrahydrodipicolinate reductase [soil metagenome]
MNATVTRVGVVGASGRMGSATCRAIQADQGLALVAEVGRDEPLRALVDAGAEVAVDFTTPDAVKDHIRFCLDAQVHAVVGTTGLTEADLVEVGEWAARSSANVVVAPNFAIGAVLMMSFAAQAAPRFERAEIVERHHEAKLDAPSGTARRTASMMNEAREERWPAEQGTEPPRSRGEDAQGVRIHSLRLQGSVAHQEVIFGGRGETLTIRHDSIDRSSFMPGVVLAIKKVASLDGLTLGLERVLGL